MIAVVYLCAPLMLPALFWWEIIARASAIDPLDLIT